MPLLARWLAMKTSADIIDGEGDDCRHVLRFRPSSDQREAASPPEAPLPADAAARG